MQTASHVWTRICRVASTYGGGVGSFDPDYYKRLKALPGCVDAIQKLMDAGVPFKKANCVHWMLDLWGTFEVTHPKYEPPEGSEREEAIPLYEAVYEKCFGEMSKD